MTALRTLKSHSDVAFIVTLRRLASLSSRVESSEVRRMAGQTVVVGIASITVIRTIFAS